VAGAIAGRKMELLGMAAYAWPVLDVRELYLWPPQQIIYYAPPPPYWGWYGPDWGWYGPGWGYWGGGTFEHHDHDHHR